MSRKLVLIDITQPVHSVLAEKTTSIPTEQSFGLTPSTLVVRTSFTYPNTELTNSTGVLYHLVGEENNIGDYRAVSYFTLEIEWVQLRDTLARLCQIAVLDHIYSQPSNDKTPKMLLAQALQLENAKLTARQVKGFHFS